MKKLLNYSLVSFFIFISASFPIRQSEFSGTDLPGYRNDEKAIKTVSADRPNTWQVGFGRRIITPQNDVWLAGYGMKRAAESKIHDLWVKVMALKGPDGREIVLVTTDHMGMSKTVYESLYSKVTSSIR